MITPIQTTGAHSTGSVPSLAKAFASDVTAGNVLVVAGGVWFTGDLSNTVTDSQGNTYTQQFVGASTKLGYWTAVAGISGPCTVTVSTTSGTNYLSIGLAEIPPGSYDISLVTFLSNSDATPTSNSFTVTVDGAALFAMMTCQGNPSGVITEDAAWTLITESTNFSYLPYSWIWRNADVGTYTADWAIGATITTYVVGLLIDGQPDSVITGSMVAGVKTTVNVTRGIAFGLDGNTNVHSEVGKFKVFGRGEYTQDLIVIDPVNAQDAVPKHYCDANGGGTGDVDGPASSVDGEIALFDSTTGKLLKRATGTGFVRAVSGVYNAAKLKRTIGGIIGDGVTVISTGAAPGTFSCPVSGTITKVRLLSCDASVTSGSIVVDVWKDSYANYPPTVADTITASAKPTISGATKAEDSTLTGWTTAVTAGDVFRLNVDSVTSLKMVSVELTVEE